MPRRIVIVGVPNANILDVTGPLEVFSQATRELRRRRRRSGYDVALAAPRSGPLPTSAGIELVAQRAVGRVRGRLDTLLVAGGVGVGGALDDARLLRGIGRLAARARRLASVCTGAFLLAEAGLLEGRRVTTHWAACAELQRRHPMLRVQPDALFVRDGRCWSSAGITAGMDLALALVEADHGRDLARAVARRLVLYLERPGGQAQFNDQLAARPDAGGSIPQIQGYIRGHPASDLRVPVLADRAHMSPRNFARVFAREAGATPARYVELARVDAARRLLEESRQGMDTVAAACGFGSAETMRRSFMRQICIGPDEYRRRFRRSGASAGREVNP